VRPCTASKRDSIEANELKALRSKTHAGIFDTKNDQSTLYVKMGKNNVAGLVYQVSFLVNSPRSDFTLSVSKSGKPTSAYTLPGFWHWRSCVPF
jgi:hypothetical protein